MSLPHPIPDSVETATTSAPSGRFAVLERALREGNRFWLWAILAIFALLYAPTVNYDLVFDDHLQIERNRHIRSWKYIGKAFTEHVWSGQEGYPSSNSYRPLYLVWMTANYGIFGEKPFGWHLTTLLLGLGAVVAFWFCAGVLLGNGPGRVVATIVFALHPTHVESTAWIAAFADPLVLIFFASALVVHLKNIGWRSERGDFDESRVPSVLTDFLSAILLLGALLAKEFAVFWGPMVFLFHLLMAGKQFGVVPATRRAIPRLLPHAFVTLGYLVIHRLVIPKDFVGNPDLAVKTIGLTAPKVLWSYLKLLIFPFNLRLEYDLGYVQSAGSPEFWSFLLGLVSVGLLILIAARRNPFVAVAAAWVLLPLLPTLNLRHFRPLEFMHDRYLFLPTFGFAMLVGWWLGAVRWRMANRLVAAVFLLVVYASGTSLAIPAWKNDPALYNRVLVFHPRSAFALRNLAAAYSESDQLPEEIATLERAVRNCPEEPDFHPMLGEAYFRAKRYESAVIELAEGFRTVPATFHDPVRCFQMGYSRLKLGRFQEARPFAERAVLLAPENAQYWLTLGEIRADLRLTQDAIAAFRKAAELNPEAREFAQVRIDLLLKTPAQQKP